MAAYLDTSVLVALFFRERASTLAHDRAAAEPALWISRWALAEFASAAAFKLRRRQTDEDVAREAARQLTRLVDDGRFLLVEIEREDFARCAQLCAAHASGLRTPDALHVAIAAKARATLWTFDASQARGCAHHGIDHELIVEG